MKKVFTLAWTTFQELVRARFFVVGIVFAVLLVALSYLLSTLSFDEENRIVFNLGLMGVEFVTIGLGLFAGATLVSREIELRTCQIILTRPLSRFHFLVGKWFGLFLFIAVILFGLALVILLLGGDPLLKPAFFVIITQIGLKSLVIMSAVFLSSLFFRPVLAALLGITLYIAGHSIDDIQFFIKRGISGEIPTVVKMMEVIIPRFDVFNWKSYYFLEKGISSEQTFLMVTHFSSWIIFLVVISLIFWRKKDIG